MSKPTYVLGTGLSHNGSSALIKDGKLVCVVEKERLTRFKHDGGNDSYTLQACLDSENITWDDVKLVVQNSVFNNFEEGSDWWAGPRNIPEHVPVVTISHHIAHAHSAFGMSPFDESAILVLDSSGSLGLDCVDLGRELEGLEPLSHECASFYEANSREISTLHKQLSRIAAYTGCDPLVKGFLTDSIGGLYEGVNYYVFRDNSDVGQLMGLSAHGDDSITFKHFTFDGYKVLGNYDWHKNVKRRSADPDYFKKDFAYYANMAKFAQNEIDRAVIELLNRLHGLAPSNNLCFAGGVALNIITNSKIVKNTPFKNLFVLPATNDSGISIGCAYYGWMKLLGNEKVKHNGSPYLGVSYEKHYEQVIEALSNSMLGVTITKPDDLNYRTAQLLSCNKVVGWYKGGAEIGPRALGHRSLLGNPCDPGMKDHINNTIKNRPDFRPFAPAVLEEDAPIYFDIDRPSPYMLMVFDVRVGWRDKIPAVTHVDGTARVQTVSETDDKDFYELLKEVKRETGIGMVLNTSFNRKHEPIVERPEEAVQMFLDTPMDALVLGPYLLTK